MKQNLLITGGLGYIGSFTCKSLLLKNKKKPFVVDNLSRGNFFAKKYSNNLIANLSNKKDFQLSDSIRDQLNKKGIKINDKD